MTGVCTRQPQDGTRSPKSPETEQVGETDTTGVVRDETFLVPLTTVPLTRSVEQVWCETIGLRVMGRVCRDSGRILDGSEEEYEHSRLGTWIRTVGPVFPRILKGQPS